MELGVINATIHKVNECVRVEDIDVLSRMYERVMELLLTGLTATVDRAGVQCDSDARLRLLCQSVAQNVAARFAPHGCC